MDRWQRINELFHSTLEREPDRRAAFLAEACADDERLRREVESLLAFHNQAESFIESPAFDVAAELLAKGQGKLEVGQQISYYKVRASLGAGGMGEVYLADDTRLGRKVALKLLPARFTIDSERVRRFEQEARAASALNHPNIVTIYEIGHTNSIHYIVTEFIEGETLRERLASRALTLGEALDIASQVSSALAAAHAAGIVHRDIKPENIMLRPDGFVKVLDFGLAKLAERETSAVDTQAPTLAKIETNPGTVMGTVQYMSPEQARGLKVDARTDIWSLGIVLYEMATGRLPFEGETSSHVIVSILETEPRLDTHTVMPDELERIIAKALSKDREERYQTASDLTLDLKSLRQELEVDARLKRSLQPDVSDRETRTKSEEQAAVETVRESATRPIEVATTHAASSAEYLVTEIKRHKTATILVIAISFIAIAAIILRFYKPLQTSRPIQIRSLTNSGKSVCAAISPDGKYVAHAEETDGKQVLLITSITTAGASQIVPPDEVKYLGLTFSHDGLYLYYVRTERASALGQLYQVALPNSAPRRLMGGVDSPITFSPNGDRFAFVRFNQRAGEYALMLANLDGTGERTLATRRDGDRFSLNGAAWSPDGKTIVCAAARWDRGYHMSLIEVGVADGLEKRIGALSFFSISQVAWLEDGSGLIISASEQPTASHQLWRVSYPQGELVKITSGITDYESVSLSRNANLLVSVQSSYISQIWVTPVEDSTRARAIASKVGFSFGLGWGSNGRIVFSSMAGGNLDISSVNSDGSDQRHLTVNAGDNYTPATSDDGRYIVFASNRTGAFNIWRMNADDGGNLKQLTFSDGNSYPSCSPDNQWVVYDNQDRARTTVWKVPIDGGDAVQLTENSARMPVVSPDNQFIACRYLENDAWRVAVIPFQGGAPVKLLPIPVMSWQKIQWLADGRALTYINNVNGVGNIWSYNLESGQSKQLTDFTTDRIFSYAWSPDFTQLACERGNNVRDVLIISNFR